MCVTCCLTLQEGFHGSAVGHAERPAPRVRGEGRVGAAGQQEADHLQMVVFHSVMKRPEQKHRDVQVILKSLLLFILL